MKNQEVLMENTSENIELCCDLMLNKLLNTNESTTKMLEGLAHKQIQVKIITQFEELIESKQMINRKSLLYLSDPRKSILYNECFFEKKRLSEIELELMLTRLTPIGNLFEIKKSNISSNKQFNSDWKEILNATSNEFYIKEYVLWIDNKEVGIIKEIFNYETIKRIYL
jgi:chorismate-pyruvate lyase